MSTLRPERCQESPTPDTHAARRISELLSRDEIATLTRASDRRGALALLASYALIATALALPALWPHPLTIAVSLVLLGGRQLALAVLMHECAHRSLFASRVLNELVGRFLCAAAIWNRLDDYRQHHIKHHNHTGTKKDPDLGLVDPFPVDGLSLARKLLRDLLGVTGLKRVVGQLLMDTGHLHYTASTPARWAPRRSLGAHLALGARHLAPVVGWQLLLIAVLWSLGHAWLYWLWLGAWLTTYSLFLRIRSMAEHACTERSADLYRNTRTTQANLLARLTVAPHHVNYHIEHHLLMTVPCYNLPRMHRWLRERGALAESPLALSYRDVLRLVCAG